MSNKIARKILLNSWGSFKTNKQFLQSYQIQRNRFSMTLKLSWNSNVKLWKNPKEYLLLPKKAPNFILSGSYNPKIFSYRIIQTLLPLPLWIPRLPTVPKIPLELKYENQLLSIPAPNFIMPCSFDPIRLFQKGSKIDPTAKYYSRITNSPPRA